MKPPTFETAITSIFKNELTDQLVIQDEFNNIASKDTTIDDIEAVYFALTKLLEMTTAAIKEGTILLIDLLRERQTIVRLAEKIKALAKKEKQDVIDLEEHTKWHERNKFVRLFVSSEKGDQLDQEKKEASRATFIIKELVGKLNNFETFLDEYILQTGMQHDDNFLSLVKEWKEVSQLKSSLLSARKNIRKGQSKLETSMSCGEGTCYIDNSVSKKYFSLAMKQLDEQITLYAPRVERLTEKVESKVLQVRTQLLIN